MKNKNILTVRRLLIYLAFSFLLVWIPTIIYLAKGGEYQSPAMQSILGYSMLCPSIAMVLTRWLTKEGFPMKGDNSLGLGIIFKDKKWIWYLVAIFLPWIYWELGMVLMYLVAPQSYDPAMLTEIGISEKIAWLYPISIIISTCIFSIGALGEEAGWRGYMMPKLEELFGTGRAILIGGVIWGAWHYPAIAAGHNFGSDYWGAPWTGFFVFTLFTIFMGAILTYLTKKTGSVWPAAFTHAVNNGSGSILLLYFNEEKLTGIWTQTFVSGLLRELPAMLFGVVAIVLLCRIRKDRCKKTDCE